MDRFTYYGVYLLNFEQFFRSNYYFIKVRLPYRISCHSDGTVESPVRWTMSQSNDYLSPDHLTVANQGQYLRQRREILWQSHRMTSL
mgnify:FL=1